VNKFTLHWFLICTLLAGTVAGAYFYIDHLRYQAWHALPQGLYSFKLMTDPLPVCGRWKQHMPTTRDPEVYRLYIGARKLWRSKIEWELTRAEALRILTDVNLASRKDDWGARALMAYFYREGLGPLPANHVLDPDLVKSVEITRMAVAAGQPWGFYDLGVAHEHGYGGAYYDDEIAWAYYYKAAQLGSPDAQMALADAYGQAGRLDAEEVMLQCAFRQGHGAAAYKLGIKARIAKRYQEAVNAYHEGTKFGSYDCASALFLLFKGGYWGSSDKDREQALKELGITADPERASRYQAVADALKINPDLRLSRLDQVLPLPPAKLPKWNGIEDALEPESTERPTY
jgi:TPR repeat protein